MLRRISMAMAVALVAAVPAVAQIADGLRALDYGDDAAARTALRSAEAESAVWLAVAERGDARKAAAERAAALVGDDPGWVRSAARGLAAEAAGQGEVAVAALREATALAPREPRLWKVLGDLLAAAKNRSGALEAYGRAIALSPSHPAANEALGDLAREAGDFGGAFNAYNHAVDDQNRPVSALIGRAAARLYLGDTQGADGDLDLAIAGARPGFERYQALMAKLFVRTYLRQLPQGLERAEQAARMWQELSRPDMVAATCNAAGRVLLETGNTADAVTWYERGWQAVQGSSLAADKKVIWQVRELHGLSRAAAQNRELERARQLYDQATALMATDPANQEHYAWIGPYLNGYLLLAERKNDEAVAELRKSDLERPYLRYLLGEAYARARDRTSAREWYQKALDASTGLDSESVLVRPLAAAWLAKNR
jgi:tetratricopeptide (TPR) repeat protein